MASISEGRKNKDGSWSFYIRIFTGEDATGKKNYSRHTYKGEPSWSKETTRKKALSYAAILDQRVAEGISPGTNIRFRDYAKEVIDTKESMGVIKHSTANRYRDSLKKVDGYIGNQKLSAIRPDTLNRMYMDMQQQKGPRTGQPPSSKTILEHHRFVSMVLEEAFRIGLTAANPAKRATHPKVRQKEPNFFDEETSRKILLAAEDEPLKWKTAINILMYAGIRKGELLGLKWDCVDFDRRTISIKKNVLYEPDIGVYEETPKTSRSVRTISMPQRVMDMLWELLKWQQAEYNRVGAFPYENGFVFAKEDGSPMHPDSVGTFLTRFAEKNGLPKLNAHAFRHTMASILFMEGMDSVSVSARLGHAQVSTTANIYAHSYPKRDQDSVEKLEHAFDLDL